MTRQHEPLFPLTTAVFPGGVLPLRIFEPRYLDLVAQCLKADAGFVLCPAADGATGELDARPGAIGTAVRITDFDRLDSGLLGITVDADRRVAISEPYQQADGLWCGTVTPLEEAEDRELPPEYAHLADLLRDIYDQLGAPFTERPAHYERAGWVGSRLAELLPMAVDDKADLLALSDPLERLARLDPVVARIAQEQRREG